MTDLDRDLHMRIDDKLMLWMKDSFELYDMAEIPLAAHRAIIHCLLRALCAGLIELRCDDPMACELLITQMTKARKAKAKQLALRGEQ